MITQRILPPEEWGRVASIEPFASGGLPDPAHWRIVVVERDGQIVACCSLFDAVHWDLFWVAESERGNPVVFKELIEGGVTVMDEFDVQQVHTTVPWGNPAIEEMLQRFGFRPAPGTLYFFTRGK
jgi:hypothetical protein